MRKVQVVAILLWHQAHTLLGMPGQAVPGRDSPWGRCCSLKPRAAQRSVLPGLGNVWFCLRGMGRPWSTVHVAKIHTRGWVGQHLLDIGQIWGPHQQGTHQKLLGGADGSFHFPTNLQKLVLIQDIMYYEENHLKPQDLD